MRFSTPNSRWISRRGGGAWGVLLALLCLNSATAAADLSVQLRVLPEAPVVGEEVRIEAVVAGASAEDISTDATLITPELKGLKIVLKDDGGASDRVAGDGVWSGTFIPAEPGRYELSVLVKAGGVTVRKGGAVRVRRGGGLALADGRERLDLGTAAPGSVVGVSFRPVFTFERGRTIHVEWGLMRGAKDAAIPTSAIGVSPAALRREELPVELRLEVAVPVGQAPGRYSGTVRLWSEYDRCNVPVQVQVATAELKYAPTSLDFGKLHPGQTGEVALDISLSGGGEQPVLITLQPWLTETGREGPAFYVEGLKRSFVMKGGSSETVRVTVPVPEGTATGTYRSVLLVETPFRQVRIPVVARVTRPPLPGRVLAIIGLGVVVAVLLALCLWQFYAWLRGVPSSAVRRCLTLSALIHAVALLISALILVGLEGEQPERRIGVQAVRIAGDGGPGSALAEMAAFLQGSSDLQEREADVDVGKALAEAERAEKEPAEPPEAADAAADLEMELEEAEQVAEIARAGLKEALAEPEPDAETPEVEEAGPGQKTARERRPATEAESTDVAAAQHTQEPQHAAAEAGPVGALQTQEFAAVAGELAVRVEAEEVVLATRRMAAPVSESPEVSVTVISGKRAATVAPAAEAVPVEGPSAPIARASPGLDTTRAPAVAEAPRAARAAGAVSVKATGNDTRAELLREVSEPAPVRVAGVAPAEPVGVEAELSEKFAAEEPGLDHDEAEPLATLVAAAMARDEPEAPAPQVARAAPTVAPSGARLSVAELAGTVAAPVTAGMEATSGFAGLGHQASAGRVVIGLVRHGGDWDCDRTAMPNLGYQLEKRVGLSVETETRSIPPSSADIFQCAFLFLSGHRDFRFGDGDIRQLRRYLNAGGGLWINDSTHEGDRTFDTAVERELKRLLPEAALEVIPMDSRLFTACYDLRAGYRGYSIPPGDKYREDRLRGVRLDGRWAVVYSRNDYGDGLEIDPNTHPLMKSLTNLSPEEMQEGSVRMGMNLTFYFLRSAGDDEMEQLKLDSMRRTAMTVPEAEDRQKRLLAGRAITSLFEGTEPSDPWQVTEGWSRDATECTVRPRQDGRGEEVVVRLERGEDGKNIIGRSLQADLSEHRCLVLDLDSRMRSGARVALGFQCGDEMTYYESAPRYVRPGANPNIVFDLKATDFKTEATGWEYRAAADKLGDVRAIYILVYPITNGTVLVRGISVAK